MPLMTRLPRILLNAATAVSLVLCVTVVASWARSYQAADWLQYGTPRRSYSLIHARGQLVAARVLPSYGSDGWHYVAFPPDMELDDFGPLILHEAFDRWGFGLRFEKLPAVVAEGLTADVLLRASVPYWALALTTLIVPAARFARHARRVRARRGGRCPACGYDLRATPARCPECGAVPANM
jgi:hypothetical protein